MTSLERAEKKVEELKKINKELTSIVEPVAEAIDVALKALSEKEESANKSVKAMISPLKRKLESLKAKAVV